MNCAKIKRELVAYLDGELSERKVSALRSHLEQCPACKLEAEKLSASATFLDEIEDIEPGPDFLKKVMVRTRSLPVMLPARRLFVVRKLIPVAAAAMIILAVSLWLAWPQTAKPVELSPEELEIVQNMEVLENIELLENMDLLSDLEILLEYEEDDFESS